MGGGSSTLRLSGSPDAYKKSAALAARLPDDLLTLFFKNSDFLDLLSLADITKCPYYVFTTAAAMEQLFTQIKVSPKRGKAGEIRFASLAQLSPGSVNPPSGIKRELDQAARDQQNELCVEVAFFFVRTFQIYAALSLSVLDTDPTRKTSVRRSAPNPMRTPGPRTGPFVGGGVGPTLGRFFGQAKNPMYSTLWEPLITPFSVQQGKNNVILIGDTSTGQLSITFSQTDKALFVPAGDIEFEVFYQKGVNRFPFRGRLSGDTAGGVVTFSIEGNVIGEFEERGNKWALSNPTGGYSTEETITGILLKQIREVCDELIRGRQGQVAGPNRASSFGAAPSLGFSSSTSTGKGAFEGFEEVKAPFYNRGQGLGKIVFPKAYAVGRAMQLLYPIFDSEKPPKDPYRSLICMKTLDFESPQNPWLPREDREPRSNIYFRSLVALYYDAYQIRGKDLIFIKTETGNSELRQASQTIGKLYGIPEKEGETFLEGSTRFRKISSICQIESKLDIRNDNLVRELQQEIIKPMLDLQQAHNKKVEGLLRKMFVIQYEKDKITPAKLKFVSSYLAGGNESVNKIGKEARDLLLDYYKKSEGYYIRGVQKLEANKQFWSASP